MTIRMLAELLNRAPGIDALEPVASYGAALALIRASNPDLALLDLHMPEMDGVASRGPASCVRKPA